MLPDGVRVADPALTELYELGLALTDNPAERQLLRQRVGLGRPDEGRAYVRAA